MWTRERLAPHLHSVVEAYEYFRLTKDKANLADLVRVLDNVLKHHKNFNYEMDVNGERWLLTRLAGPKPKIVFDVGANHGHWSKMAADILAPVTIHAFEIVPETFAKLHEALGGLHHIHLHPFGLGAEDDQVMMRIFDQDSGLSTQVEFPHGDYRIEMCPLRKSGDVMEALGLDHLDMMKLDVEGAEPKVLEGMALQLRRRAIDVIQFEYGQVNILTRHLLADFYAQFEAWGYRVGKLMPDHVAFGPYDFELEDFLGPNFIACRADRDDLLTALRG